MGEHEGPEFRVTTAMLEAALLVLSEELPNYDFSAEEKMRALALTLRAFFEASGDQWFRSLSALVPTP